MKYARLSSDDEQAFLKALDAIWQAEGYDWLAAIAAEKSIGKKQVDGDMFYPAEQVTMRRSEVIAVSIDRFCGSMLGRLGKMNYDQYNRIREWVITTPDHIVNKVAKKQFTYGRYGA